MDDTVKILPFQASHAKAFHDLNLAWIKAHFVVEPKDKETLENPVESIINPGGAILIAVDQTTDDVLGTAALIRLEKGRYELAKMAVADAAKGRGIGYQLGLAAIDWARGKGAGEVYLETNSSLTPAIRLYEKLGFIHVHRGASPYARADVQMALGVLHGNGAKA